MRMKKVMKYFVVLLMLTLVLLTEGESMTFAHVDNDHVMVYIIHHYYKLLL